MRPGTAPPEAFSYDTLGVITDRLKLLATRKTEMWWDIGCLLDAMATRGFAAGAGDWAARAQQVMGIERAEARRIRRVARLFSRELAMRFGLEKLELLLKLVETLPEAPPLIDPLRVEVMSARPDRSMIGVTFAECSLDDLRFTIKALSGRKTKGDIRFGATGEVRDALDKALRRAMRRKAPKVKVDCMVGPRQRLALIDVAPEDLETVGKTLVAQAKAMKKAKPRARA